MEKWSDFDKENEDCVNMNSKKKVSTLSFETQVLKKRLFFGTIVGVVSGVSFGVSKRNRTRMKKT